MRCRHEKASRLFLAEFNLAQGLHLQRATPLRLLPADSCQDSVSTDAQITTVMGHTRQSTVLLKLDFIEGEIFQGAHSVHL